MLSGLKKTWNGVKQGASASYTRIISPVLSKVNQLSRGVAVFTNWGRFLPQKRKNVTLENTKRQLIYAGKFAFYAKEKVLANSSLETTRSGEKFLHYKNKKYPLVDMETMDADGNALYKVTINDIEKDQYSDFGLKSEEEAKESAIVIPIYGGEIKREQVGFGEKIYQSFSGDIDPRSFAVANIRTKEVYWLETLILLPLNFGGAVIGYSGRLLAGIIDWMASGFDSLARVTSKNLNDNIINKEHKVINSINPFSLYMRSILAAGFSDIASIIHSGAALVRDTAEVTESVVRFPTSVVNYLWNEGDKVPLYSGFNYIKQSFVDLFTNQVNIFTNIIDSGKLTYNRCAGNVEKLHQDNQYNNPQQQNKGSSKKDKSIIESKELTELGKKLSESGVQNNNKDNNEKVMQYSVGSGNMLDKPTKKEQIVQR